MSQDAFADLTPRSDIAVTSEKVAASLAPRIADLAPGESALWVIRWRTPWGDLLVGSARSRTVLDGELEGSLPVAKPVSLIALRRGIAGTLDKDECLVRRPKYGFRRNSRRIQVSTSTNDWTFDYTNRRSYVLRRRDESLAAVGRYRNRVVANETCSQGDVAVLALFETSGIVASSSLLSYVSI